MWSTNSASATPRSSTTTTQFREESGKKRERINMYNAYNVRIERVFPKINYFFFNTITYYVLRMVLETI